MMVHWSWQITRDGAIRFSLILLTLSFSYHNLAWLNSLFLPQLPVGYILFGVSGIFVLRHIYRTLRWYSIWLNGKRYQKYEKLIMHVCLYLVVISVVLSVPVNVNGKDLSISDYIESYSNVIDSPLENNIDIAEDITEDTQMSSLITTVRDKIFPDVYTTNLNIIGGDGHTIKLVHNNNARDPTYSEMCKFLWDDHTDSIAYDSNSFVCADFAEQIQNNAENNGYKCGYVSIDFSDVSGGHACNVFNTTDKGLIFVDCTNSVGIGGPSNEDCTVNVQEGSIYHPRYIFPSDSWETERMGTVASYDIYWS